MSFVNRRTAAVAALAVTASVVGTLPAQAAEPTKSRITTRSSDYDVASGEQFVLRGAMSSAGDGVDDATVRVLTLRNGHWSRLRGAHVMTHDNGRYRVRVVLSSRGDRHLRVAGIPSGDDVRRSHRNIRIDVH